VYLILLDGRRHVGRVLQLYSIDESQVAEMNVQIATERAQTTRTRPPCMQVRFITGRLSRQGKAIST